MHHRNGEKLTIRHSKPYKEQYARRQLWSILTVRQQQSDASSKGLGFILIQEGRPVSYASRALTPAEQNYSQIEKELLAQIFGVEHHHTYIYGREITLWTDHKPLVSIIRNPLASIFIYFYFILKFFTQGHNSA